jgi:hypothetical protein
MGKSSNKSRIGKPLLNKSSKVKSSGSKNKKSEITITPSKSDSKNKSKTKIRIIDDKEKKLLNEKKQQFIISEKDREERIANYKKNQERKLTILPDEVVYKGICVQYLRRGTCTKDDCEKGHERHFNALSLIDQNNIKELIEKRWPDTSALQGICLNYAKGRECKSLSKGLCKWGHEQLFLSKNRHDQASIKSFALNLGK